MPIYFDNAATSWPKPPAVRAALDEYFSDAGGNPGRSGHQMSIAAARLVENSREALAQMFNAEDPSRIVFTIPNVDCRCPACRELARGARPNVQRRRSKPDRFYAQRYARTQSRYLRRGPAR